MQLGAVAADNVLRRALEELALRLSHAERLYQRDDLSELRKNARSLKAISHQVGMTRLGRVAGDVALCIDQADSNALAATLSRLIRVGDRSLSEVCDLQDLSV